ncbi:MAG: membrane receptor RagA [Flavobacterium psychrophilum]|nr:MAG: membrane receptor RagA [Flavobacterium psychrophilum]
MPGGYWPKQPECLSLKKNEGLKRLKFILLLSVCTFCFAVTGFTQNQKRVIQLSGVILNSDSVRGGPLPGVHVYVPKAGRGTTTNRAGFFSMPVLVGDSVVISSVGFVRRHYIVPNHHSDLLTIVIEMMEDTTVLPEVVISQFPTEEVFKQAVLALNVPLDEKGIDPNNLNAELLALMLKTTPMDGNANYRYYIDQYAGSVRDQFQPRTNPFLNPFNWARFFRDLKKNKK